MEIDLRFRLTRLVRTPGDVRSIGYNLLCGNICLHLNGLEWGGWIVSRAVFRPPDNLFRLTVRHQDAQPPMNALPDEIILTDIWIDVEVSEPILVKEMKLIKIIAPSHSQI